jgi:8-oxo-dGTP diphosphatase
MYDASQNVAVIRRPNGFFLPGGGAEPGENPEQTLHREILEECGAKIRISHCIGNADQLVVTIDQTYFCKICTFFEASLLEPVGKSADPADELVWLKVADALTLLSHGSQRWAVTQSQAQRRKSPTRRKSAHV